ncbi:hypothetical protein [Rhodococcus sp. ARP2]|uniref:Gp37-like protein n=1 Tax=Rhodococcus sp. ARP2 TaxID=1661385 RepID=UPI00064B8E1C|nr:hypothetical protein [Rhodococcus sp. ARP2]
MSAQTYADLQAEAEAERKKYGRPRARVRFMTKDMETFGYVGDYRELKFTEKKNAAGGIAIRVPETPEWSEYFYGQDRAATRPIVINLPGYKTLWFTTTFARVWDHGQRFIQVIGVHALEHLNWIRIWPNANSLAEFQWPKNWFGLGGAISQLKDALEQNLRRLQGSKFHPIMVNPRGRGLTDTSGWTSTTARMTKYMDLAQDVCSTENLVMTADLIDPEEDEQPFPEHRIIDRPTLVIDFKVSNQPTDFTGTVVDGILRTGLQMLDDAIEWISYPILDPETYDDYLQKQFGQIPEKPFAIYRLGQHSTIDEAEEVTHIPLASRATVGGKSPGWLNTGIKTGLNLLLGMLLPGLNLGIFEDQVSDVVMAFHSAEDARRAKAAGVWRFKEAFAESATTGLSLNAWAAMKKTLFDHRDYVSQSIKVSNGKPYYVGLHLKVGQPVGYSLSDGTIRVDTLEEITYEDSRSVRGEFTLQIGSGEAEKAPGEIALGKLRRFGAWITSVALGT